jgi:hypothetical protein
MRWWVGMGKRKYRHLPSTEVANKAWAQLTKPDKISEMKANYASAMDALPTNTEAESRYKSGVQYWTETMRTKEVREAIMKAVTRAKSIYLARRLGTSPPPAT